MCGFVEKEQQSGWDRIVTTRNEGEQIETIFSGIKELKPDDLSENNRKRRWYTRGSMVLVIVCCEDAINVWALINETALQTLRDYYKMFPDEHHTSSRVPAPLSIVL
jgi:hypothetical protein